jgi:hypothetical protein
VGPSKCSFSSFPLVSHHFSFKDVASTVRGAIAREGDDPAAYGLYIPPSAPTACVKLASSLSIFLITINLFSEGSSNDLSSRGTWLDPQRPLNAQPGGVMFCQYKLRPWSLTVQLSPSKPPRSVTADVDPNSTVLAAIATLRQRLNAPPSAAGVEQEYSLHQPDTDTWLEDTRKLLFYPGIAVRDVMFFCFFS